MNDVINHESGTCVWYHTTPNDRVGSILRDGLKVNSKPTWQDKPEPWIYVSTLPWGNEDNVTILEVDLSVIETTDAGWPFVDEGTPEWEERWQLRVFKDIPPDKVKLLTKTTA